MQSLQSSLHSGELNLNGKEFHTLCLTRMDQINEGLPEGTPDRSAFLKGCMYDIADRCLLRFERSNSSRSLNRIAGRSIALPLSADDIIEFHLARLLLLLKFCGTAGRIEGLTKMAKLDFFARYPDFFWSPKLPS